MAHVQQQIRENSMELQDYLRELKDWEAKAKAKDQVLRGGATSAPVSDPAPIRGQPKREVDARESELSTEKMSQTKRGEKQATRNAARHTYDYFKDKWDKFDVDKALAEADDESPGSTNSTQVPPPRKHSASNPPITSPAAIPVPAKAKASSSQFTFPTNGTVRPDGPTVLEEETNNRSVPDAASEKEEGNRLFKAGRFAEAFEAYGRSLALGPTSVAYANRAMAALKSEKFHEAENDCTAAIDLDARYVKAFSRRGRARSQLRKWLEAAEDFEFALRLEPHNKELLKEYSAARDACQREAKLSPSSAPLQLPVRKEPPPAAEKATTVTTRNGPRSLGMKAGTSGREEGSAAIEERAMGLTGGVPAEDRSVPAECGGRNGGLGNEMLEGESGAGYERVADGRSSGNRNVELGGNGNGTGNGNGSGNGNGNGNGNRSGSGSGSGSCSASGNGNGNGNANGLRNGSGNGNGNTPRSGTGTEKGNGNGTEERRGEKSMSSERKGQAEAGNGFGSRTEVVGGLQGAEHSQGTERAYRMPILDSGDSSESCPDVRSVSDGHVSTVQTIGLPEGEATAPSKERAEESPVSVSRRALPPPRKEKIEQAGAGKQSGGVNEPETAPPGTSKATKDPGSDVLKSGPLAVASAAAEKLQRALAENVCAPRTAYEFEAHWKGFKDDAAAKAKLLKTLQPSQLAPFFKESLQAPLLCDMLRVAAGELLPGNAAFVADLLEGLSAVPRFAMTVMFIGGKDKQVLRQLWDTAATEQSIPVHIQKRLAACRTKYRM